MKTNRWKCWADVKPLYFAMEKLGYGLVRGGLLSEPFKLVWQKEGSVMRFDWWDDVERWLKAKGVIK